MKKNQGGYVERVTGSLKLGRLIGVTVLWMTSLAAAAAPLTLSEQPLSSKQTADPNVMLDLSIEFPTVGAAYNQTQYIPDSVHPYVGYFDPGKCYDFDASVSAFVPSATSNAVDLSCNNQFSGNFMNWTTMSAMDIFRSALTGGNRVVDTDPTLAEPNGETILGRAYLYFGPFTDFRDSCYNFPRRTVGTSANDACGNGPNVNTARVLPSSVTPYSWSDMTVTSYRDKVIFRRTSDNSEIEFPVRVRVCKQIAGLGPLNGLEPNCETYSAGGKTSYKPTGEVQRNAKKMRFGLASYLNDDSQQRRGAVLRSKLKYVGPEKVSPGFSLIANANKEWNEYGVFYPNPDPLDTQPPVSAVNVSRSGVANYLNQFGSTGSYKTYDSVGELYYESLRYLQGTRAPTPNYIGGATAAMSDDFPVLAQWDDPIDPAFASCQSNFIIVTSDVNTWFDARLPGGRFPANTPIPGNGGSMPADGDPGLDVGHWTDLISPGLGSTWRSAGMGSTYYLAGLAYYANAQDIRPDGLPGSGLPGKQTVKTFVLDVNEPGARGPASNLWLAAKYGGFSYPAGTPNPTPSNVTDWAKLDASGNPILVSYGGGMAPVEEPKNYVLSTDPNALITGLRNAFGSITSQSVAGGSVSTSSAVLGGSLLAFLASYDPKQLSGELVARRIDRNPSGAYVYVDPPVWIANDLLTARCNNIATPCAAPNGAPGAVPATSRNLLTTIYPTAGAPSVVKFEWGNLAGREQDFLNMEPTTNAFDGRGAERLSYLAGVRTSETMPITGSPLRNRGTDILGTIVDSTPLFVGPPNGQIFDPTYRSWADSQATRTKAVYVGANDGMLHGFNADTGVELFGYIPSMVYPKLSSLTSSTYTHRFFVDGPPSVDDAQIGGAWESILTASVGVGAQGLFALKVTDPSAVGASNVLWEFSDRDDADLGNVLGSTAVVKLANGEWGVIVGNGVNNSADGPGEVVCTAPATPAGCTTSTTGKASLFVLLLNRGGSAWVEGTNYFKISTGVGSAATPNGLGEPVIAVNGLGVAQYVYAGDLQGNMWKFDLTNAVPGTSPTPGAGNWKVSLGGLPLFTAQDSAAPPNRQSIVTQPQLVRHPRGGLMVLFGTGKLLERADRIGPFVETHSFYGIWDQPPFSPVTGGRSNLTQQIATDLAGGVRQVTTQPVDYTKRGWYLDLPDSGERNIASAVVVGTRVVFPTFVPSASPCDDNSGWLMQLDAISGQRLAFNVFDTNGDGAITAGDTTIAGMQLTNSFGAAVPVRGEICVGSGCPSATANPSSCPPGLLLTSQNGMATCMSASNARRISWRELMRDQ